MLVRHTEKDDCAFLLFLQIFLLFFLSSESSPCFYFIHPPPLPPSLLISAAPLSLYRSISFCEWMPENKEMNGPAFIRRCVSSSFDMTPQRSHPLLHKHSLFGHITVCSAHSWKRVDYRPAVEDLQILGRAWALEEWKKKENPTKKEDGGLKMSQWRHVKHKVCGNMILQNTRMRVCLCLGDKCSNFNKIMNINNKIETWN